MSSVINTIGDILSVRFGNKFAGVFMTYHLVTGSLGFMYGCAKGSKFMNDITKSANEDKKLDTLTKSNDDVAKYILMLLLNIVAVPGCGILSGLNVLFLPWIPYILVARLIGYKKFGEEILPKFYD